MPRVKLRDIAEYKGGKDDTMQTSVTLPANLLLAINKKYGSVSKYVVKKAEREFR